MESTYLSIFRVFSDMSLLSFDKRKKPSRTSESGTMYIFKVWNVAKDNFLSSWRTSPDVWKTPLSHCPTASEVAETLDQGTLLIRVKGCESSWWAHLYPEKSVSSGSCGQVHLTLFCSAFSGSYPKSPLSRHCSGSSVSYLRVPLSHQCSVFSESCPKPTLTHHCWWCSVFCGWGPLTH